MGFVDRYLVDRPRRPTTAIEESLEDVYGTIITVDLQASVISVQEWPLSVIADMVNADVVR